MKLKDKVAIVTGASAGMGKSIAQLYAAEGARVFALARRLELLEELSEAAKAQGKTIVPIRCDMADSADVENAVKTVVAQCGTVDVLVNNAGMLDNVVPLDELTDALWEQVMQVNLTGPMQMTRSALRVMLEKGSGSIINIASVGGLHGCRAGTAYTASKFGMVGLTKSIAFMYAEKGIRCNAICPGAVATDIGKSMTNLSKFGYARLSSGKGTNPRTGRPEEIASVALFFACEESSFVNGEALSVDGGWSAY